MPTSRCTHSASKRASDQGLRHGPRHSNGHGDQCDPSGTTTLPARRPAGLASSILPAAWFLTNRQQKGVGPTQPSDVRKRSNRPCTPARPPPLPPPAEVRGFEGSGLRRPGQFKIMAGCRHSEGGIDTGGCDRRKTGLLKQGVGCSCLTKAQQNRRADLGRGAAGLRGEAPLTSGCAGRGFGQARQRPPRRTGHRGPDPQDLREPGPWIWQEHQAKTTNRRVKGGVGQIKLLCIRPVGSTLP